MLWAEVVQSRAAVPDAAALDAVQQVDPGLPDAVNRRQVASLQSMAGEFGLPPSAAPEAAGPRYAWPMWPTCGWYRSRK